MDRTDPLLDRLPRLVAEIRARAADAERVTFEHYHVVFETTPRPDPPSTAVRIAVVREPISVEQPVEEDAVEFTVAAHRVTAVRFTRTGFESETENARTRAGDGDQRLVEEIRDFFAACLPLPEP